MNLVNVCRNRSNLANQSGRQINSLSNNILLDRYLSRNEVRICLNNRILGCIQTLLCNFVWCNFSLCNLWCNFRCNQLTINFCLRSRLNLCVQVALNTEAAEVFIHCGTGNPVFFGHHLLCFYTGSPIRLYG